MATPPAEAHAGSDGRTTPSLESLTAEQHRILAYASAIGSEFDFSLLLGAMGTDEESLAEELERLVHLGVLVERAGGERFAFAEEEFRARIYRSLTESRLRVLHRKIGEVLERANPDPSPAVLTELGRHYFLGKIPSKSYEYNRRAATAARLAGEPEVAVHHLERVLFDLASLPGDRLNEQAEVAETLGNLELLLGDYRAADAHLSEAFDRLGSGASAARARLLLGRADVARESLDFERTVALATEAQRMFEEVGDRLGQARCHRLFARVAFRRGAYRDSLDECMQAFFLAEGEGDSSFLGSLSVDFGNALSELGPDVRETAVAWYERAVERLLPTGDSPELSRAYLNLGVDIGETRPQDGIDVLEKAIQASERAHDIRGAARARVAVAELRLSTGQLDEAERDNEQVSHLLEHVNDGLGKAWVEVNRGLIAERRGLWEEAIHAYERTVEMCRRFELPGDEAEAAFYLARVRYKTRDLEGARQAYALSTDLGVLALRPQLAEPYFELGRQIGVVPTRSPVEAASGSDRRPTGATNEDYKVPTG
jgi:tetratricopeptide (TPR) repeat protein